MFGAPTAGPEPASQVRAVLERIVDFVADDPLRGRVLYVEALGNEALNRRRIEAGHQFVDLLERGARSASAVPPRTSASAASPPLLVGGFGELLRGWLDGRIDVPRAQLVDDASALFLAIGEAADRIATARAARRARTLDLIGTKPGVVHVRQ